MVFLCFLSFSYVFFLAFPMVFPMEVTEVAVEHVDPGILQLGLADHGTDLTTSDTDRRGVARGERWGISRFPWNDVYIHFLFV